MNKSCNVHNFLEMIFSGCQRLLTCFIVNSGAIDSMNIITDSFEIAIIDILLVII